MARMITVASITIIMVNLPEPDGPATPIVSPAVIDKSRPRKMLTSPLALTK